MIKRTLRRFPHAFRGIWYALCKDFSFQTQFYGGLVVAGLVTWFAWPLATFEFLFLALGYTLLLITELQNSSVEASLDHLHPDRHDAIKVTKDMAAGAVIIAGGYYGLVVLTIVASRLFLN